MATELYGVDARLVDSIGTTPVSTETTIIFIGASPSGTLNKPVLITSFSDYATKLGGAANDQYNLTEAAIAAFTVANIDKCWMIPVSHSTEFTAADYTGDAENETGVYAVEKLLRENPTTVNILCAPSVTDIDVLEALNTVAQKAAGHWQSFMVFDLPQLSDQINEHLMPQVDEIVDAKQLESERTRAVWGSVVTSGGKVISGAAVQACLMCVSDANFGVPARCGGNLSVPSIQSPCVSYKTETTYTHYGATSIGSGDAHPTRIEIESGVYVPWNDNAVYTSLVEGCSVVEYEGSVALQKVGGGSTGYVYPSVKETLGVIQNIDIPQAIGNQLSADGICSWINYGGGNWHTWGDHTSAFSSGSISDERGRFDNYMRMQMMIANRFQLKYRFSIDDPMTLQMRNDVITEEEDFLNSLVAIGALVGSPKVEFVAADNSIDQVAQGYFTWSISTTEAPPLKYMLAKVAYTQEGLEVFTQEG